MFSARTADVLTQPSCIVPGLQGTLLFCERGITPPTAPDGNIWYTQQNLETVSRMTASGNISTVAVSGSIPVGNIIGGPDGNIWFVHYGTNEIVRLTIK